MRSIQAFGTMKGPLWKVVVVAGLVVGGWLGWWSVSRMGTELPAGPAPESVALRQDPPAPVLAPAAAPAPAASPETHQAYSLVLGSFREAARAEKLAEDLAGGRPDLLFTITPVRVGGQVFLRVLAGPAEDSLGAERLRTSLAETLSGVDASQWIVRATPLAFDLGDEPTQESAQAMVQLLRQGGLNAYVLSLGAAETRTFKVYAGAFSDEEEAAVMRAFFDATGAGVPNLVNRLGSPVS